MDETIIDDALHFVRTMFQMGWNPVNNSLPGSGPQRTAARSVFAAREGNAAPYIIKRNWAKTIVPGPVFWYNKSVAI